MSGAARRLTMVVLLIAVALLASGCRKVVSDTLLEPVVADLLLDVSGEHVQVDCPAGRTMRKDNDFFCDTTVFGRHGTVLVVQKDDYGHVELQSVPPLHHDRVEPLVESWLKRQHRIDAQVHCPTKVIQQPDRNFDCRIEGGGRVHVRQVDGVADYSFELRGRKDAT